MNKQPAASGQPSLEVLFTPAEFAALSSRDLTRTTCVVFDVLRATSTMVTALSNGAQAIIPVRDIPEALEIRSQRPDVILGGERDGRRIRADLTGGIDFDLGNSPREYTADRVAGKTIVSTTTNGTRALRACASAKEVFIGSFLNLAATAEYLREKRCDRLLFICSGTYEEAAWEDALAAGALTTMIEDLFSDAGVADSVNFVRQIYARWAHDLNGSMHFSCNARRLLAIPELHDDVQFCLRRDAFEVVAGMAGSGEVIARLPITFPSTDGNIS